MPRSLKTTSAGALWAQYLMQLPVLDTTKSYMFVVNVNYKRMLGIIVFGANGNSPTAVFLRNKRTARGNLSSGLL